MKHFTFFGCVATLLLASSLPWGYRLAANAPNTPTPIDAEWMEEVEDITWKFAERNRHTLYSPVWNENGGYYGTCIQEAYFVLPDAQTESIWFKVRVTENPSGIRLSTQNKSIYFDSGERWIPMEECPREEGSMEQMVPIRAEAYGSGNCTFVIEAYKSQSDVTPIDSFTTSVQFYMNMPTARLPFLINRSDATLNITTGDLSGIEAYVDLRIRKQSGLGIIGWSDDSGEIKPVSENHWKGTLQSLSDRTLTTHFSFQQEGSAEYLLYLMDAAGDPIYMQAGTIVYPFKPSSKDSTTIANWAVQNPENKSIADFISSGAWKEDREYEQNGPTIGVKWDTHTPAHVTNLFITSQSNSLQQLNLAGLDSLQRLTLNGNNFLSQLEGLTDMPKLERIVLYGSALGYTSIDFPAHFDKANIMGISNLRGFGTTRSDNYTEEVASGTTIDVSSYAQSVDGYETTCSWSKNGSFISNEPVYTLEGAPGDVFKCEFQNAAFPNWNVQTVEIYIVKTFAATDVATLAAIVNGSTSTSFKQWYEKGLWKESGEVTLGDGHWISIYWSDSGRLQTLSMPFWEEALPSTIDLSALDELSSLDLSFNNIESLTLPTNPEKLTFLQVASNPLTSLDITKCINLQQLNVGQTALGYTSIDFPAHFDKANITGISNLRGFGTTRSDNYTEEVASGTTIDVSSYAQSVDGYETTCTWSKNGSFVSNEPVYTLEGAPGDVFKCEFHNAAFPNWNVQTVEIYIVKTFAADDVATLEAIVNGSTSTSFKQWYNKGLWQESGEVTLGDGHWISIYWSDSGRLQTLSMPFWEEALPSTIDLSALDELSSLDLSFNNIESLTLPTNPEKLTSLQVASNPLTSLDITQCVNLQLLNVGQTAMHFSDIINPHQLTEVRGQTRLNLADKYFVDRQGHIVNSFVTMPAYVDFSKDLQVGDVPSVITWEALIDTTYQPITLTANAGVYAMSDAFKYSNHVRATITNTMFPGWNITLDAQPFTQEGDANFDREVNVQDISATTAYILEDEANILPIFGFCQADVDQSKEINISDVVAMVKIINGQPSSLKSIFHPTVFVTSEADGRLYIDAPVEVAGLQLTIAGASQAIPLLGEAANLTQVSVVKDSVRTLAYSLSGKTIPAGRTLLAQLPKGAKVVEATFADAQANLLLSDLTGSATATEDPMPQVTVTQVSNYPNPFRGQTTFTYGLGEQADEAVLRVYQANGALVHLSKELPAAQGENQYTTSIDLPAGIYYYQLIIQRAGRTIRTMSNNFIIK